MSSQSLDNLIDIGKLKREPPSLREQQGLFDSAESRMPDAAMESFSFAKPV